MKTFRLFLALALFLGGARFAVPSASAGDRLLSVNPTNAAKTRISSIEVVSGQVVTSNSISSGAVAGTNAGPGSAGQVVKLNNSGLVDSTLIYLVGKGSLLQTNIASAATTNVSYQWTENIASLTTTTTSGVVVVSGSVAANGLSAYLRVRSSDGAMSSAQCMYSGGGVNVGQLGVTLIDVLSGTNKTYVLDISAAAAPPYSYTNRFDAGGNPPAFTNAMYLRILQIP